MLGLRITAKSNPQPERQRLDETLLSLTCVGLSSDPPYTSATGFLSSDWNATAFFWRHRLAHQGALAWRGRAEECRHSSADDVLTVVEAVDSKDRDSRDMTVDKHWGRESGDTAKQTGWASVFCFVFLMPAWLADDALRTFQLYDSRNQG